ncbi:hypothetical protein [Rhizobium sp. Leaf311]|uniref:hypothetical protein n=1 Tax=Rhizobium sp. Leaf311 TaxID=1736332 RepID=UPI000ABBC009|nr:hypothetical protein [Rhizobium sp. Leaf311]
MSPSLVRDVGEGLLVFTHGQGDRRRAILDTDGLAFKVLKLFGSPFQSIGNPDQAPDLFVKGLPTFPKTLTKEFLLIDLVNNLGQLAEDRDQVLASVTERALQGDRTAITRAAKEYGMVRTQKFFNTLAGYPHAS